MADRSILVKLRADVSDLQAKLKSGAQSIKGISDAAEQASSKAGAKLGNIGTSLGKGLDKVDKHSDSINRIGNGFLLLGTAAAAGVGVAVKKFADFDQAMSNVKATGADAAANLDQLREAALKAGASTAFSATEAAEGVEALAKAGVSAQDVLSGGLDGALSLAAAGQTDVAFAAEAAASAMNQFGLAGKDVPHIADLLAQAAGTAQGEVSDMAGALNQSGLIAAQFGLSIDETAQALALFAKNGLVGSDAGTSFKTMLTSLYAPAGAGAKALERLGISAYDASGNMKDIGPLADDLKNKLDGLSEGDRNKALRDIFGSDAIRAGTILLKDGSKGLSQMATEFGKFGSAADVAATKMDNLKGDIENFTGALETAFIGAGSGGNDFLRSLTQGATDAVNAFNNLDAGTQQTAFKITAVVAGAALAVGGLAKLAVSAAETRVALTTLGITATNTRAKLAGLNGGGLLAVAGFVAVQAASAALDSQLDKNSAGIDGYKESLASLSTSSDKLDGQLGTFGSSWQLFGQGIGDTRTALRALADTQNPVSQGFRKLGDALGMSSTAGILADEFDKIDKSLTQMKPEEAAAAFKTLSDQGRAVGLTTKQINATFDDYLSSLKSQGSASDEASASADKVAKSLGYTSAAAQQAAEDVAAVTKELYDNANASLALSGNAIAVEQAMDDAAKAAKTNGENLDISTAKGRANQQALDSLASSTLNATQAMVEQGKSAESIVAVNERAKASWIKNAEAMGMNGKEARKTADALFAIPKEIRSQVVVAGGKVSAKEAKDLNKALEDIPPEKRAEIVTIAQTKGAKEAQREIAKVKSKEVIAKATGKGVNTVKEIDAAIKKLKSKEVRANAKAAGKKEVDALDKAIDSLKSRKVTASASASGEAGVRSLRSEINRLQNKTVFVRVKKEEAAAAGGLIGSIRRSNGGPVWGAGSATSDSIPAMLSNGEFVVKAASVLKLGVDRLQHMNQFGTLPSFATGGPVGFAQGGGVSQTNPTAGVDFNTIWKMITAITRPLAAIVSASTALAKAQSVKSREDRESKAALAAYQRAVAADKRADAAAKKGGTTKGERARAKATEAAKDKAEAAYKKQVDQQKDATSKLTDATNNLKSAQQALADSARSQSDALSDPYRSKSTDIDDWLEAMNDGAADLKLFQGDLAKIRQLGVSETIVQQITDQGAVVGHELAQQILDGGKALAGALNTANGNLQKAADGLGYDIVSQAGRYATGGMITGAGSGTSDSILARVSNGEWIVPQKAVGPNLRLLQAMTYGKQSYLPAYAHGGPVRPQQTKTVQMGDQYVTVTGPDPDVVVRKMNNARRDAYTMATSVAI